MALSGLSSIFSTHHADEDLVSTSSLFPLYDFQPSLCNDTGQVSDGSFELSTADYIPERLSHPRYLPATSQSLFGYFNSQPYWQNSGICVSPTVLTTTNDNIHGEKTIASPLSMIQCHDPLDQSLSKTEDTMLTSRHLPLPSGQYNSVASPAECCHGGPMTSETNLHPLIPNAERHHRLVSDHAGLDSNMKRGHGQAYHEGLAGTNPRCLCADLAAHTKRDGQTSEYVESSESELERTDRSQGTGLVSRKHATHRRRWDSTESNRNGAEARPSAEKTPLRKRTPTSYDPSTTIYLKTQFFEVYGKGSKLSKEQRRRIELETGLPSRKITYWFSNHKRRYQSELTQYQALFKAKCIRTYKDFLRWKKYPTHSV